DEALREGHDLPMELGGRDVLPAAIGGGECEQRRIRCGGDAIDEQVGRVRLRVGGDDGGDKDLVHGSSFGTERGRAVVPPYRAHARAGPWDDAPSMPGAG